MQILTLSTVEKVTKLRLPDRQHIRTVPADADFECKHSFLTKRRIGQFQHAAFLVTVRGDVERDVDRLGLLIDERSVTLRKSASLNIFSAQTHVRTLLEQRAKGDGFGRGPLDVGPVFERLQPLLDMAAETRVKVLRNKRRMF